jgi:hypothetical protein
VASPPLLFTARQVRFERDETLNTDVVTLSDADIGQPVRYLLLQRSTTADDQDRDLGLDTYWVSTDKDEGRYGGIEAYAIGISGVTFRLSAAAAKQLGVPQHFVIGLGQDNLFERASQCLPVVLRDVSGT